MTTLDSREGPEPVSSTIMWKAPTFSAAQTPAPDALNALLLGLAFTTAIALLALASRLESAWAVLAVGIAFSYVMLTDYALLHEATHGLLNRNPRINYWLGVTAGALFPVPFSMIRTTHQGHHLNNRTDHEMFDLYYRRDNRVVKYVQWYGILCGFFWPTAPLGAALYSLLPARLHGIIIHATRATGGYILSELRGPVVRLIRLETLGIVTLYAIMFWLLDLRWPAVLVCYACFSFNWSTRQYIGHAFTRRHVIEGAWNLRHLRWMSWVLLHGEYDLNHHRRPDVPWLYLPRLSPPGEARRSYLRQYWRQWLGPRPAEAFGPAVAAAADTVAAPRGPAPVPGAGAAGPPLLAWPGWPHLRFTALLAGAHTLWFCLVYHGADGVASLHSYRVPVHFGWELAIPFWPPATLVYMSIYLPFLLAPFVLRSRREIVALTASLAAATTFAGVCFVLIPAEAAYPPIAAEGYWRGMFELADRLNLRHNLLPSLHVALSAACLAAFAGRAGAGVRLALFVWAMAVGASTLLTHQHHVLDVLAGLAVAGVVYATVFTPLAGRDGD